MSQQHVDALARHAARVSRRGSLATLGGAGVAALLGSPLGAEAKHSGKGKIRKKQYQKVQGPDCTVPGLCCHTLERERGATCLL